MNERSIPEIMGWSTPIREWGYGPDHWNHPSNRFVVNDRGGWTVDDMLAWLHDPENERHGWSVLSMMPPQRTTGWTVLIGPWADEYYMEYAAPTLHAALEDAVRAVAEATP